jgi:hypothetical protein
VVAGWYGWKAKAKASAAKHLRRWSLILFAIGTIAPISVAFLLQIAERFGSGSADKMHWNTSDYFKLLPMAEVGYLLLALTGALIIFDQFFDSSGSWIPFRQSEARLQVLLAEFRFAWTGLMAKCGGTIDPNQVAAFTSLARDFVTKVEILAEEETTAWAQRFSERLSSFDRNPSLKVTLGGEQQVRGAANGSANRGGVRQRRHSDRTTEQRAQTRESARASSTAVTASLLSERSECGGRWRATCRLAVRFAVATGHGPPLRDMISKGHGVCHSAPPSQRRAGACRCKA